jgi:Flp pilus assembly protein TadG
MGRGQVRRHRGSRGDRGAAAVEFALVALPLFLILFGIIQYGFLFYQVQGAAAASKDAAKWAAQGIEDCSTWLASSYQRAQNYGVGRNLGPQIRADYEVTTTGRSTVTVSVTFTPVALAPLVPVPASVVRTTTTDVETFLADGVSTTCGP